MIVLYTKILEDFHNELLNRYIHLFNAELQEKILKYKKWDDCQRSLLGYVLLSNGLERLGMSTHFINEIMFNDFGKPYIKGCPIYFNISHSKEIVVCALSNQTEIGIDIEYIQPICFRNFRPFMLSSEWSKIKEEDNCLDEFYHYWTQKEAVLKADGSGLSTNLRSFEIKNGRTYINNDFFYVTNLYIEDNYCCNLAIKKLHYRNISIDLIFIL